MPEMKDLSEKLRLRQEEERSSVHTQAAGIEGYEEWRAKASEIMHAKRKRKEAFDLVFSLISKFRRLSLYQFSYIVGVDKKQASRVIREWKMSGKIILMTTQDQGHPYVIVTNEEEK